MITLSGLRAALVSSLDAGSLFSDCKVTAGYPTVWRDYPLDKPVIALCLHAVEAQGGFGGFLGAGADADYYGSNCTVTVRFDIYTPVTGEHADPHELMERIWERLLISENTFGFLSFRCGGIEWDPVTESNRLTAWGKLRLTLSRLDEAVPSGDFRVTRVDGLA